MVEAVSDSLEPEKSSPGPEEIEIGRRIRRARNEASLKQTQLAELMEVSERTIWSWENGFVVPWAWFPQLAEVLHKPKGYFFGQEEGPTRSEALEVIKENLKVSKEILRLLKER